MGMSAHYYAYAQDVIEAIKNGGGDDDARDHSEHDPRRQPRFPRHPPCGAACLLFRASLAAEGLRSGHRGREAAGRGDLETAGRGDGRASRHGGLWEG